MSRVEGITVSGDSRAQCGPAAEAGAAMDTAVREAQPQPRLAAAGEALGTGLRGGGGSRRNGVTAERRQLIGESAGRGVSASRARMCAGPESGAESPARLGRQAPGVHSGCPKHTATGLVMAKFGESPGRPELSRDLSPTRMLEQPYDVRSGRIIVRHMDGGLTSNRT